jgi:hypothetical protein
MSSRTIVRTLAFLGFVVFAASNIGGLVLYSMDIRTERAISYVTSGLFLGFALGLFALVIAVVSADHNHHGDRR